MIMYVDSLDSCDCYDANNLIFHKVPQVSVSEFYIITVVLILLLGPLNSAFYNNFDDNDNNRYRYGS